MPVQHRVIVVGGGLAGLSCSTKLAEEGIAVDLFSLGSFTSSASGGVQSGINACNDIARQQGYSEWTHFDETILGGDFLADQPPVHEMCNWAPRIIDLLDRMGVPFDRTPEGQRALALSDGSLIARTYFSGATTGRQLLYAFDEQVRRHQAGGRITAYEAWEFLWPIIHESACVGIVAQDLRTMQIRAFKADAVVIATGGAGQLFAGGTTALLSTGAAASRCYQAGAKLANPEFVQFHPTAIAGPDKALAIADAHRAFGARLWVPALRENSHWKPHPNAARGPTSIPESERYYFLEERHSKYGNLVPRDVAARHIIQTCRDGFGIAGGTLVYLDPGDAFPANSAEPVEVLRVYPAPHVGMGGLWVDFKKDEKTGGLRAGDAANLSTNIAGLYALGEANFAYHGANRLCGNGLLSRIFDGLFGGSCVQTYCQETPAPDAPQALYDAMAKRETDRVARLGANDGDENPHLLCREMQQWMSDHCGAVRENAALEQTLSRCQEWKDRATRVKLSDTSTWANQAVPFARATRDRIVLAEAVVKAALLRNESRGAHYKPEYPERDDANFLKATIALHDPTHDAPAISYEPVDTSLIAPRPRTYGKA